MMLSHLLRPANFWMSILLLVIGVEPSIRPALHRVTCDIKRVECVRAFGINEGG